MRTFAVLLVFVRCACDSVQPDPAPDPPVSTMVSVEELPPIRGLARDERNLPTRLVSEGAALAYEADGVVHVTTDAGATWRHELLRTNAWGVSPTGELAFVRDLENRRVTLAVGPGGEAAAVWGPNPTVLRFYADFGATFASVVEIGNYQSLDMAFDSTGQFHSIGIRFGSRAGFYLHSSDGQGFGLWEFGPYLRDATVHPLPDRTLILAGRQAVYRRDPFGEFGRLTVTGAAEDGGRVVSSPGGRLLLAHSDSWVVPDDSGVTWTVSDDSGVTWTSLGATPGWPRTLDDEGFALASVWTEDRTCCRLVRVRLDGLSEEPVGPPPVVFGAYAEQGLPWVFSTREGIYERHVPSEALQDAWKRREAVHIPWWHEQHFAVVRVGDSVVSNLDVPGCVSRSLTVLESGRILAACQLGVGVKLSDDGGRSWEAVGGPDGAVRGVGDDLVYGVARDGQFWRSSDAGRTWEPGGDQGGHDFEGFVAGDGAGTVVATAFGTTQVLRSEDHGSSWTWAESGLPGITPEEGVWVNRADPVALAFDPGSGAFLLGTKGGLYVSVDGGSSWALVRDGPAMVRTLSVDPERGAVMTDRFGRMWLVRVTSGG